MAISESTLSVDVWNTVKALIVAAAPATTNPVASASINAAYNDKTTSLKPQVVVNPIQREKTKDKFGEGGRGLINITVDCYASGTLGTDELADKVIDAIEDTNIDGVELIAISTDQAFVDPNQSKFQLNSVTFTFLRE